MKIFVGYGFNDRDRWVEDFVFPIIRAFGDEVITGDELHGEQITDAVIQKIRQSNALIGFTTRRGDPIGSERWLTHRWVTDEISQAAGKIPIIEVREVGVDPQGGIVGDRQHVVYNEKERDKCLVELVKAIGKWHQERQVQLQLLPQEFVQNILPHLKNPGLRCTYKLLVDDMEGNEIQTKILPIKGGLFMHAKGVQREALIQIHVECMGNSWTSNFESTDSLNISLRQD